MDNPSKTGRVSKALYTHLQNTGSLLVEESRSRERKRSLAESRMGKVRVDGRQRGALPFTIRYFEEASALALLRRGSEEKAFRGAAVSRKGFSEQRRPTGLSLPPQTEKVSRYLLPSPGSVGSGHVAQIVPLPEHGMSTSKSPKDRNQPKGHQPRGEQTVLINPHRGTVETLLSHLPAPHAQEQRPHNSICRILNIGDQLNRQQREGPRAPSAQETGNGDAFLLKPRKQFNGIAPVGSDRPVTMISPANGASGSDKGGKINPTGKKRFLVFPNRSICVRVGKLNLSAPCMQGSRLKAAQTLWPASLQPLVILPRSISYLVNSPTLISSVNLPRKFLTPCLRYIEGDNTELVLRIWQRLRRMLIEEA